MADDAFPVASGLTFIVIKLSIIAHYSIPRLTYNLVDLLIDSLVCFCFSVLLFVLKLVALILRFCCELYRT